MKRQNIVISKQMVKDGKININLPKKIWGDFICVNLGLTTLEGSPQEIDGFFDCTYNKLSNLVGSPILVKSFYCNDNLLTSLEGCPITIGGNFHCNNNLLTSLKGGPNTVGRYFDCKNNKLIDLKHCPIFKEISTDSYLKLERIFRINNKFIKSYWSELFIYYKYFIKDKSSLNLTVNWPIEFINSLDEEDKNLIFSNKLIKKYSL